jgi:serine/threonine-protein kinase
MPEITSRLSNALADRYRLERHLGEGGMATVYLAHDLKHDRKVAVKILRPELAAIIGGERFVNEIKVTANLQHPNILPLYDSGEADTFLYYVMPFMEGETLRDKMEREKQLGVDEVIEIAKDVGAALHFAHERGVVHRDIKPENILMQDGKPLVADFGIALAVTQAGGSRLTETGLSLGTPHYMSPEQAMGDRAVDARSDVYALGAMVYEMLVGEPPHHGTSVQAIVARILSDEPEPITKHRKTVPPHVEATVRKALEKTPADRFTSAAKFVEALQNPSFTLATTQAAAHAMMAAASGPWKRIAIGVSAVAVVLLALTVWGWMRPDPPARVSRYSLALPEGQEIRLRFGRRVVLAPDGSRFVYVGPGQSGDAQLWVRRRDQLGATPIPGTEGAVHPTFSPDGGRVAFLTAAPRTVKVVSLGGGPPITVSDTSGVSLVGLSWGMDGFLYVNSGNRIGRIPAAGGEVELVSTIDTVRDEAGHGWPEALPGGRGVLFTAGGGGVESWNIAVLDLATGTHRTLVRGIVGRYVPTGHLVYATADGSVLAAPFDLNRMDVTGEAVALFEGLGVRDFGSIDLSVSDDGTLAYLTGSASGGLGRAVWVDRNGMVTPVDPEWMFDPGLPEAALEIAPDGRQVALKISTEAGEDIWVKQLDRGPLSRLTFDEAYDRRPRWTADGRHIMFTSDRGGNTDLWMKPADGTGPAELLLDFEQPVHEIQRTPDESWWVLRLGGTQGGTGQRDLVGLRTGDTTTVPIAAEPYDEKGAALSPDGRWLAYESNETGRNEVYVRPFPNASAGKWQVSTGGGINPRWAHTGQEIFFVDGAGNMAVAEVDTRNAFRVGTRQVLFSTDEYNLVTGENYASWDVGPDDQRFMMIQIGGETNGTPVEFVIVENWFEELKTVGR